MLIIGQRDVQRVFTMRVAIETMRRALLAMDRGEAMQPLRSSVALPAEGAMCWLMPAVAGTPASLGVKVLTAFAANAESGRHTHQGAVLLFGEHGELLALVDATAITAIRTAAVSAVATDALAREDATRLAILGSGAQAMTHLEAMLQVRRISGTNVWSRNAEHASEFARNAAERFGVEVNVSATAATAVSDADIVCTATGAHTPILAAGAVPDGAHINAVGSGSAVQRELDGALVRDCRVFVDRLDSALHEAGDILLAIADGIVTPAHIVGEVGAVLAGRLAGRQSAREITLFKSVGLAVEDVASARHIYAECLNTGTGQQVELDR